MYDARRIVGFRAGYAFCAPSMRTTLGVKELSTSITARAG